MKFTIEREFAGEKAKSDKDIHTRIRPGARIHRTLPPYAK